MNAESAQAYIWEMIQQHGQDPISMACTQTGLSYFTTSFGIQAYKRIGRTVITLGPPICSLKDRKELMRRFSENHRKAIFCYLCEGAIKDVNQDEFYISGMGIDRYVNHRQLYEKPSKTIKGALKQATKAKLELLEVYPDSITPKDIQNFQFIQESYLNNFRYKKEITFINTPFSLDGDYSKRYFFIFSHDQTEPFGFLVLNPYFNNTQKKGYLLDIIRFKRSKIWGVWFSCVSLLSSRLANEGFELCLGYCPLHEICTKYDNNRFLSWQTKKLGHILSRQDYPRRLYSLKQEVPGFSKNRYVASYSPNSIIILNTLFRASGVQLSNILFGKKA